MNKKNARAVVRRQPNVMERETASNFTNAAIAANNSEQECQ